MLFASSNIDARLGSVVAGIGDVNGDGRPDIAFSDMGAFGAPGDPEAPSDGRVHVIFGSPRLRDRSVLDVETLPPGSGFRIDAPAPGIRLGSSLSGGSDVDGDGIADFAIGATRWPEGGAVFLVFGRADFPPRPALLPPDPASHLRFRIGTARGATRPPQSTSART